MRLAPGAISTPADDSFSALTGRGAKSELDFGSNLLLLPADRKPPITRTGNPDIAYRFTRTKVILSLPHNFRKDFHRLSGEQKHSLCVTQFKRDIWIENVSFSRAE